MTDDFDEKYEQSPDNSYNVHDPESMDESSWEVDTVTLPAYWASLLINGDDSGFADSDELARARRAMADLESAGWEIVSCDDEARFTRHYQLYDPGAECSGGEVLEYTIIRVR